jgi:hypothetical protein
MSPPPHHPTSRSREKNLHPQDRKVVHVRRELAAVGGFVYFRRAKIREHRCKQQMPPMGMARNYDDPEGSFHE